jgi:hypothetical protein
MLSHLSEEKKKDLIKLMMGFMKGNKHALLRLVLTRFHQEAGVG